MKYTPNLNLKKPDGTDIVDIDDFNLNFDTLDTEILKRVEKTKKLTTSYDLNTLVNTGFYNVENPVNAPSGITGWCYIISIKYSESTSYLAQFLIPFGSNRMFFRRKSSTWQIWIELANKEYFINELTKKVDKISGKGLSTNDYTTAEKNKLAGIETGANKTTINNTLTSTSTTQALSAKQGKTLKNDLDEHKAEKASQNKLGHVKVDEKTIFINEDGEISVNNPYPHDFSGSPGSKLLIAGTMEEGFFGEVPASELITGDALASECGIAQGTSQFSTEPWLKFAYKGEIQFVAKKPIRSSISWDAINTADCVYGDSGDKTIEIGGLTYKVRLLRALEPLNDPKTVASANSGEVNHGSEWNRLMCQIHEQATDKSWDYPSNVESNIGMLKHNLGNGNQGMYSDADLVVKSGDGRYSWCQEMGISTSLHLHRGHIGVSYSNSNASSGAYSRNGWRPVLELVP